ncbi:acyl-CoA thioesterase [Luteibaculum oceani]|uniref:Acyl-CoA thioesterase n=1 Tax=Luteibaculum oceani TaxID=1294296 RepID=A0A5C6V1F4_9FLAO|nr:hotdog domain-containing protein [Luteibaculum oceani]TXC78794.1 acyl-CoA thioesterase [Luteibaculum oceani]
MQAAKKQDAQVYTFTVFPEFLNYAGTLFGGKLLSEMDLAASNCARRALYGSGCDGLVTAHVGEVNFLTPAYLGDIVELHTDVLEWGNTSVKVGIKAIKEEVNGQRRTICDAFFVFVALQKGKPFKHKLKPVGP